MIYLLAALFIVSFGGLSLWPLN